MIKIEDLSQLDPDKVTQNLAEMTQFIQDLNPDIDLKRGVLYDLLIYTSAVLATASQENVELTEQSTSLLLLSQNPAIADEDLVKQTAANFRVTPIEGTPASGNVRITLNKLVGVSVPSGTTFTSTNGIEFVTEEIYTARTTSANVIETTDRLLTSAGGGNYSFTVPVIASEVGTNGNVRRGIQFEVAPGIPSFVSASAASAFSGGTDDESISSLIERTPAGISNRSTSNRLSIDSLIRSEPDFEDFIDISVIGYGDDEMTRYHSLIPIAFGGRVDIYIRPTGLPNTTELTLTATLVDKDEKIWQVGISRDDAPGFYEVDRIIQIDDPDGDGYEIISDVRSADVTLDSAEDGTASTLFMPDIDTGAEATYSRYQTAVIQFNDIDTSTVSLNNGDTRDYLVILKVMPFVAEVQDLLAERDVRLDAGDCLIKAGIPCFMTITITVNTFRGTTEPSAVDVQNAVADYVNSTGFVGSIRAANIISTVQSVIPSSTSVVTSISMTGRVLKPGGTEYTLTSSSAITILSNPTEFSTTRTAIFILDPDDVTVTINTVD